MIDVVGFERIAIVPAINAGNCVCVSFKERAGETFASLFFVRKTIGVEAPAADPEASRGATQEEVHDRPLAEKADWAPKADLGSM